MIFYERATTPASQTDLQIPVSNTTSIYYVYAPKSPTIITNLSIYFGSSNSSLSGYLVAEIVIAHTVDQSSDYTYKLQEKLIASDSTDTKYIVNKFYYELKQGDGVGIVVTTNSSWTTKAVIFGLNMWTPYEDRGLYQYTMAPPPNMT